MPASTPGQSQPAASVGGAVLEDLYRGSLAAEFGFTLESFSAMLEEIAARHDSGRDLREFCLALRIEDLVLARACAAGNERAWETFLLRFREKLYDIARQITREDSSGRELADSAYADLYGVRTRDGERVSKLMFYSGRGSLEGWLRTVLAQEFVNTYRRQRRLVSMEQESEDGAQFATAEPEAPVAVDPRLADAIDEALRTLEPEERFILSSYFLDGRTLADIARALSVHESTISRKVERLTKQLRKDILKNLARRGLSRRQAEEALAADVRDLTLDIRASLAQDSPGGAFSEKRAKAGEGGT